MFRSQASEKELNVKFIFKAIICNIKQIADSIGSPFNTNIIDNNIILTSISLSAIWPSGHSSKFNSS